MDAPWKYIGVRRPLPSDIRFTPAAMLLDLLRKVPLRSFTFVVDGHRAPVYSGKAFRWPLNGEDNRLVEWRAYEEVRDLRSLDRFVSHGLSRASGSSSRTPRSMTVDAGSFSG